MKVSVCFSSDNNYAKYLGIAIQSIVHFANPKNTYDIYVLDDKISELTTMKIHKLEKSNVQVHFIDISFLYQKYDVSSFHISGHISKAAYFRLFMPEIFPTHDKMIYLDCDLIVNTDIAHLFQLDLDNNFFAAVQDIGLIYDAPSAGFSKTYLKETLKINSAEEYFNSGVLLMNLKKIRENMEKLIHCIQTTKMPKCHDQCILNRFAYGKVFYLPLGWNYWGNFKADEPNYKDKFPKKYLAEFEKASATPFIIHAKPWNNPDNEWAELFWMHAKNTPFYESILYANLKSSGHSSLENKQIIKRYKKYLLLSYLTLNCVSSFRKKRKKYYHLLCD